MTIQHLRGGVALIGTAAELATANPVLLQRQLSLETDTGVQKIGDGTTHYASLTAVAWASGESGDSVADYRGVRLEFPNGAICQNDEALALAVAAGGTLVFATVRLNAGDSVNLGIRSANVAAAFGYAYIQVARVADDTGALIPAEVNWRQNTVGGVVQDVGMFLGAMLGTGAAITASSSAAIQATVAGTYEVFGEIDFTA